MFLLNTLKCFATDDLGGRNPPLHCAAVAQKTTTNPTIKSVRLSIFLANQKFNFRNKCLSYW